MTRFLILFSALLFSTTASLAFSANDFFGGPYSLPTHPQPELHPQPEPRVYKTAQGFIDFERLEGRLMAHLQNLVPIRVSDMRWPYDPLTYADYLVGSAWDHWQETKYSKVATYIVSLTAGSAGEHEFECVMTLWPNAGSGKISDCVSKTASMPIITMFQFEDVGLPAVQPRAKPAATAN